MSDASSASSTVRKEGDGGEDKEAGGGAGGAANGAGGAEGAAAGEGEDTMKNLRKTFAGIFGDIN